MKITIKAEVDLKYTSHLAIYFPGLLIFLTQCIIRSVRFEEGAVAQVLSPHGDEFNRTIIPSAKSKSNKWI